MGFGRHADKFGTVGSIFAALCCLGTPALLAFRAAIGAGFLVNDLILLPLLAVSLGVALWGLGKGKAVHRRSGPERSAGSGRSASPVAFSWAAGSWRPAPFC